MSKKIFVLLLMAGAVICAKAQQVTMMVASDTHVMDKSLFDIPYGEAFIKAMQQDLKVAESSQQLFEQFATIAMRERPQLLLIPGDLTKDGERASHEYMARKFKEIEAGGTKVYVIPGNHDMENPKAVRYNGTKTERVPSVSEAEFREIYKDYGYSEAVSTDSVTGSYMVYPVPGLAIVCLNTNIPNQYKSRYVHGRLFRPTLTWIERAATKARLEGRYVIAMAHHELMQHHNQEDYFAPTAMLNMERGVKNLPALKRQVKLLATNQKVDTFGADRTLPYTVGYRHRDAARQAHRHINRLTGRIPKSIPTHDAEHRHRQNAHYFCHAVWQQAIALARNRPCHEAA